MIKRKRGYLTEEERDRERERARKRGRERKRMREEKSIKTSLGSVVTQAWL